MPSTSRYLLPWLLMPLLAGCAGHMPWQANEELNQRLARCETRLGTQLELNQSLLLRQEELQADLDVRLDRLEDLLRDNGSTDKANADVACTTPPPGEKVVFGRLEWVSIQGVEKRLKARIDTGAATSSLHAENIVEFERDGKRWVRFTPDKQSGAAALEAPIARYIRIRQASATGTERRPVVTLPVKLGRVTQPAEFSLTDREQMLYPVLLGRNFFMDIALVDVGRKFVESGQRPPPAADDTP
ncbi:MAG: RimK/LysX family protein [Gammaproteobacteria bacterium]|nr:RimK/LysX family protein [Gammaproteobacteria bacterium]